MRQITEYLSTKIVKPSIIKATNETIQQIVKDELDRLGHDADLNHIDVSEVTDMDSLFSCHDADLGSKYSDLNPDISKWDVSNVEDMSFMFWGCKKFNQDISQWDVRNVKYTERMFMGCESFNQPIGTWDVSKVVIMNSMFFKCINFDQNLSSWKPNCRETDYNIFRECPIKEEFKPKFKK